MLSYDILYIMPGIRTRNCSLCKRRYTGQGIKFCSPECYHKTRVGRSINVGKSPWNKGIKLPSLGKARKGAGNPAWRGGITYRQGYKFIKMASHPNANKGGYVAEHRIVMENKIGRYLDTSEQIHHLDFSRANNDPDNLIILTRSEHMKLHRNRHKDK